jgi:hypothetical protein
MVSVLQERQGEHKVNLDAKINLFNITNLIYLLPIY